MRAWFKNFWKLTFQPYAFFEEVISNGKTLPATLAFIIMALFIFCAWWFVGTNQLPFVKLLLWLLILLLTYPTATIVIFLVSHLLLKENKLNSFFMVWGFSYLPTFVFYFVFILIQFFSKFSWFNGFVSNPLITLVFWAFCLTMFLWKLLFLAITLRLAGNLNLKQIIIAAMILLAIVTLYWWICLSFGWLKIPFL